MDDPQQLEAHLDGLSASQMARLLSAVTAVTLEAQSRFGIAPTMGEVLATAQVKSASLEGYEPDIENALFELKTAPSVSAHMSASADRDTTAQAVLENGETPTGLTAAQIADMPPHVRDYVQPGMSFESLAGLPPGMRMTIARCMDLTKDQRNPSALSAPEVRDAAPEQPAPTDSQTRNAVPPHRQLNDAAARMDAARAGAK